jgi:glycosyltransferase involved in cell wall biosynthesis
MNILWLSATEKIGGAERVLLNTVEGLPKSTYRHFLISQEEGPLTGYFSKLGGKVFILKLPAWRKIKYFFGRFKCIFKIINIARREHIDLIYANGYRLNPYVLYVSRLLTIPVVTHVHDVIKKKHVPNFLLNKARNLIVPSDYVKKCLGIIKAHIFLVPNAIKVNDFLAVRKGRIRREFGIADGQILIGMVGNFVETKGHRFFINAASLIREKINNVKFIIVGDNVYGGPLTRNVLIKFAQEKNIAKDIIFTGERNDIAEILSDLDYFILPSEKESFSLVVLEAMASRVLVIAHKFSGGPSEIIRDGQDGLLVDCANASELSTLVIDLIEGKGFKNVLVDVAFERVKNEFDMTIFISRMKKSLEQIIGLEAAKRINI